MNGLLPTFSHGLSKIPYANRNLYIFCEYLITMHGSVVLATKCAELLLYKLYCI